MKKIKKLFGGIDLTWKKLIIFAILSGVYTALMALIPAIKDTSFHDISVSFEVWILFGIIIIMNSKSAKDSALKCFVFFLISQPLVYLIQVPFSSEGIGIFRYYGYWFIWTIATILMGYVGYYMKKNKWWGLLILCPILLLLGTHYYFYLKEMIYNFPYHLITVLFCLITILIYPLCIFNNKRYKSIGLVISTLILIISSVLAFTFKFSYNTIILISNGSENVVFDDGYKVYMEDDLGNVYIEYKDEIGEYVINGDFVKTGKTKLILESNDSEKYVFDLEVNSDSFNISKE